MCQKNKLKLHFYVQELCPKPVPTSCLWCVTSVGVRLLLICPRQVSFVPSHRGGQWVQNTRTRSHDRSQHGRSDKRQKRYHFTGPPTVKIEYLNTSTKLDARLKELEKQLSLLKTEALSYVEAQYK